MRTRRKGEATKFLGLKKVEPKLKKLSLSSIHHKAPNRPERALSSVPSFDQKIRAKLVLGYREHLTPALALALVLVPALGLNLIIYTLKFDGGKVSK